MNYLLRAASYLFHPVWMPLAGSFLYFLVSPRFFPQEVKEAKLLAIAIMSVFIPIVFFFMLKTLGKISSHFLTEVKERRWPLLFYAGLNFIILKFVLDSFDYPELYFYFAGILSTSLSALLLLYLHVKASLHMMGLGGITVFIILLSLHFNLNLVYTLTFFITVTGLTASSRLHYSAHTGLELVLGLLLGAIPQLVLAVWWL